MRFVSTAILFLFYSVSPLISSIGHYLEGSILSPDIFCAEISTEKSQRFKEMTKAVRKSKHEFWYTELFITVKSEPLINDQTAQIKITAPAELFHLRRWYDSLFRVRAASIEWKKILLRVSINRNDATNSTSVNPSKKNSQMIFYFQKISFNCA
jgi:hypothetical protein